MPAINSYQAMLNEMRYKKAIAEHNRKNFSNSFSNYLQKERDQRRQADHVKAWEERTKRDQLYNKALNSYFNYRDTLEDMRYGYSMFDSIMVFNKPKKQ